MSKPYIMSRAISADLDDVMTLIDQRIRWLRERDSDQWNTGRPFRSRMENSIARGETWLLRDAEAPIATITLRTDGDPDFWSPAELAENSIYVEKMATSVDRKGENLGRLLLKWAQDYAFRNGATVVRWDVWRTNEDLQDYYRKIGAKHIRTEDVTTRWSGSLFELNALLSPHITNEIVTLTCT
jgi:GNAT superfamily N-acetyltransferase